MRLMRCPLLSGSSFIKLRTEIWAFSMTSQTTPDNKLLALVYACGAVGIASSGDTVVKWLSGDYPVHQVLVIRCLIGIPILAFIVHRNASFASLIGPGAGLSLTRGLIMSSAYLAF